MGQSSSASSKSALPARNLLIDASDSYVTEVKLKSTGIIPISEYIKKDKYSKNTQRLQKKENASEGQKGRKSKDKDETSNKLFTIKEEKSDKSVKRQTTTQATSTETVKKEKKLFIESSFEDIPSKRKWINVESSTSNPQPSQSKTSDRNHHKNRKTQTTTKQSTAAVEKVNEVHGIRSTSSEEIRQLYKNRIYPHIYKNKYKRNSEQKQKEKRKDKPLVPSESQICFSDTEIRKKPTQKPKRRTRFEESTHQLNQHQHHYHRTKPANPTPKQNKFSVQTNVACIIHPDRRKQVILASSEETLRRRPPPKRCFTPPVESSLYLTYPRDTGTQTAPVQFQRKADTLDKVSKEHRKFLSGRQALENWKNIHTLKQHRKNSNTNNNTNYYNYQEDYRYNNRPHSYEGRSDEYFPSRHVRSRAGNREDDYKMTPLEISNYNYSKPTNVKIGCIAPTEIKERNQTIQRNFREYNSPEYNRPESPRYEFIENTSYGRYNPTTNKYQNYEEERNYYRNSPRPDFSERDERAMDREDFITDIERCLQKKIASVYGGRNGSSNRTTWVQDKYRRWHKVSM